MTARPANSSGSTSSARGPRRADARAQPGDRDVGAERPLLGRVDAGGLEAGGDARLQLRQGAGRVLQLHGEDAGPAGRQQQHRAEGERRRRATGTISGSIRSTSDGGREPRKASVTCSASGLTGRQTSGSGAQRGKGVADRVGEVERDEEPQAALRGPDPERELRGRRRRRAMGQALSAGPQQQGAEHVQRHGGRAVADVSARAREADGAGLLVVRRTRSRGRRCRPASPACRRPGRRCP